MGLTSRAGVMPLNLLADIAGPMARTVEDAVAVFQAVVGSDPADPAALAGAGISAFHLGNYPQAQKFLRAAPADRADVRHARTVTDLVLSRDPLGSRIGNAERRRRLIADIEYVQDRLAHCAAAAAPPPPAGAPGETLVSAFHDQLDRTPVLDQDTIEAGLDLIGDVENRLAACGPREFMDDALTIIVRAHAAENR
jgi:hypothetical protein